MRGDIGPPFKQKRGTTVHRIKTASGRTYYLKRSLPLPLTEGLRLVLRALRRGEVAHTEAFRVQHAARTLAALGFDTMHVAAWGEERILGIWPRRGFVLARAVEGWDAAAAHQQGPARTRVRIMRAVGDIVGRLHAHGIFVTLRLHDLIGTTPLEADTSPRLTMIDLDFGDSSLTACAWDRELAAGSLANSCYLALRCGHRFSPSELRAALRRYRRALRSRTLRRSVRRTADLVADELDEHVADPSRVAMFPDTPRPSRRERRATLASGLG